MPTDRHTGRDPHAREYDGDAPFDYDAYMDALPRTRFPPQPWTPPKGRTVREEGNEPASNEARTDAEAVVARIEALTDDDWRALRRHMPRWPTVWMGDPELLDRRMMEQAERFVLAVLRRALDPNERSDG